jgi:hypothetical protein
MHVGGCHQFLAEHNSVLSNVGHDDVFLRKTLRFGQAVLSWRNPKWQYSVTHSYHRWHRRKSNSGHDHEIGQQSANDMSKLHRVIDDHLGKQVE